MRLFLALVLLALCYGCASSRRFPPPAPPAVAAEQPPLVWVRGDVKNPAVPWTEDLTLARAIVEAEYKGLWDPHRITIVRGGQSFRVSPRDLLRGRHDIPLEPSDVIVIER